MNTSLGMDVDVDAVADDVVGSRGVAKGGGNLHVKFDEKKFRLSLYLSDLSRKECITPKTYGNPPSQLRPCSSLCA